MLKYLSILSLYAIHTYSHDFKSCGSSTDPISIQSLDLSPDSPVKDQDLNISLIGTSNANITNGQVDVNVKYIGITVVTKTLDICKLTTCPVVANEKFVGKYEIHIPAIAPSGTYDTTMTLKDGSGNEIGCIDMNFDIK